MLLFFPQLIAGPIVRYTTIENELVSRTHTLEKTAYGIWRFVIGLSKKKVIFANSLGELVKIISNSDESSGGFITGWRQCCSP